MFRNLMRLRPLPPIVRVGGKVKPKAKAKVKPLRPAAGEAAALTSLKVSTVAHVSRQVKAKAASAKPLTGG